MNGRTASVSIQRWELALLLGALTAFAPLSIDMYLPALPTLEAVFNTTAGAVQRTLSTFFIGFALGQAFYGPLVDRFGRKIPLYGSLVLYIVASIGCVYAPTIEFLSGMRLFQALGACAGVVIARAVVRDLFSEQDSIGFYANLMLISGLAPMLAPAIGGFILKYLGWAANFWVLAAIGFVILLAVYFRLPETLKPENRQPLNMGSVLSGYGRLLKDRTFVGYGLCCGFAMAGLFAYLGTVPFVMIKQFNIAPEVFGFLFAGTAFGFILSAQINGRLLRHLNPKRSLLFASIFQVLMAVVLLITSATGFGGIYGFLIPLFLYIVPLGFIMPNTTVLVMAPMGNNAGVASALLGLLQNGLAAAGTVFMGYFSVSTALSMASAMVICTFGTFAMLYFVARNRFD